MPKGILNRGRILPSASKFIDGSYALTQVHKETGLVHGDVKPSNIVMVRNRVFLIDFGNAWTLEQSAHRPSGEGLSGPYSSPEQYRGDGFSGVASDYFSASVIGYQLLTRQLPFNGLGGKSGISQGGNNTTVKLVPASELSPYRALMRPEFWQHIDQILSTALDLTATNRFPIASAGSTRSNLSTAC